MNKNIDQRPELDATLSSVAFSSYYWEKKELMNFCRKHALPCSGSKQDIATRIEIFLDNGKIDKTNKITRKQRFDSEMPITLSSKVINFKCDTKTREFFIKHIGARFKFNDYLRQFAKTPDVDGSLIYKDLVDGWLENKFQKNKSKQKAQIGKQFKFNQFQRDFYAANKHAAREEMLAAWKLVRSVAGAATYEHYIELKDK